MKDWAAGYEVGYNLPSGKTLDRARNEAAQAFQDSTGWNRGLIEGRVDKLANSINKAQQRELFS